jgi:hypothetical protein
VETGRGVVYWGFENWMKGTLGMGSLSLKWLTGEGLEGGFLYRGPWVMNGIVWRRESLHGCSVGQHGLGSFTGGFEK